MHTTESCSDRAFVPQFVCRCPTCASTLLYVREYGPEIVPNGQRLRGLTASYVYRCPNDGLWHVYANGNTLPYATSPARSSSAA